MLLAVSGTYWGEFTTSDPTTGAATNATGTPAVTANHNGTDDGSFTFTVTNVDTGRYKVTGTVPGGYAAGDTVQLSVSATVAAKAGKAVFDTIQVINFDFTTAIASQVWDAVMASHETAGTTGKKLFDASL